MTIPKVESYPTHTFHVRTLPRRDGLPYSSSTVSSRRRLDGTTPNEQDFDHFNQYVHPFSTREFSRGRMIGPLWIQVFADGVPIQILFEDWRSCAHLVRPLAIPPIDEGHRAVFGIADEAMEADPKQHRLLYDPAGRRACMRLFETAKTRCLRLATSTLVEITPEGDLVALWMLDVDTSTEAYEASHSGHWKAIGAMKRKKVRAPP